MPDKKPARPAAVPASADWIPEDEEWEVGQLSADGRKSGLFRYFRADGSLCNECVFADGAPHGPFKRFHENGELAQDGQFVRGKLHGTQRWFGCDVPTTEVTRQPGTNEQVWRSETDWDGGRALATRHYDREGHQISPMTGERLPDRPAGLPAAASFRDDEQVWRLSQINAANQLEGPTRSWSPEGALLEEGQYRAGVRVGRWRTYHPSGQLYRDEQLDAAGELTDVLLVHDADGRLLGGTGFQAGRRHGAHHQVVLGRGFADERIAVERGAFERGRAVGVWSYLSSTGAEIKRVDYGSWQDEAALLGSETFANEIRLAEIWAKRVKRLVRERAVAEALCAAARALGCGEAGTWKTVHPRLTAPVGEALARERWVSGTAEARGELAGLVAALQAGAYAPLALEAMARALVELDRLHVAHDLVRAAIALAPKGEAAKTLGLRDEIEARLARRAEKRRKVVHTGESTKPTLSDLQAAIAAAVPSAVEALIARGLPEADEHGNTALHVAAASGNSEIAFLVVSAGAALDAANAAGLTPLHAAAELGHAEVIRVLAAAGADVDAGDLNGLTPLHRTALGNRVEAAKALLECQANPNRGNVQQQRPLHYAAAKGAVETLRLLIARGAKIDAPDRTRWTALHLAAQAGKPAAIQALIDAGANPLRLNDRRRTPLQLALESRQLEATRLLKPLTDALMADLEKPKPLLDAVHDGDRARVAQLLAARADPDQRGHQGWTPLLAAIGSGDETLVRLLIEAKATVDLTNDDGLSPLLLASRSGSLPMVQALLGAGAKVDGRVDDESLTPLMQAASAGHEQVVGTLLAAGANPELTANGESFVGFAACGNLVERVAGSLEGGADANVVGGSGRTLLFHASSGEMVALLAKHGAEIDRRSLDQSTPLYAAAESGRLEVLLALIDAGADVDAAQRAGQTPLFVAAGQGHVQIVKALLQRGADPHRTDHAEWGPLHMAAQRGHAEVIAALLDAGVDRRAANTEGQTARDLAEANTHAEALAALSGAS